MLTSRDKFYTILMTACIAGYIWIYYSLNTINNPYFNGCLINKLTNIPCPSCGSTRSIILLIKGDFFEALKINPFGYVIAVIMTIYPIWILIDILTNNESLYILYKNIEATLKKRKYALPLILIVIVNWIWNITKGL